MASASSSISSLRVLPAGDGGDGDGGDGGGDGEGGDGEGGDGEGGDGEGGDGEGGDGEEEPAAAAGPRPTMACMNPP